LRPSFRSVRDPGDQGWMRVVLSPWIRPSSGPVCAARASSQRSRPAEGPPSPQRHGLGALVVCSTGDLTACADLKAWSLSSSPARRQPASPAPGPPSRCPRSGGEVSALLRHLSRSLVVADLVSGLAAMRRRVPPLLRSASTATLNGLERSSERLFVPEHLGESACLQTRERAARAPTPGSAAASRPGRNIGGTRPRRSRSRRLSAATRRRGRGVRYPGCDGRCRRPGLRNPERPCTRPAPGGRRR